MNQVSGWWLHPGVRFAIHSVLLKQTTSDESLNQEYRSPSATDKWRNRSYTSSKGQLSLWHPWQWLTQKTPRRGSRGLKSPSLCTEAGKDKDLSRRQGKTSEKTKVNCFFSKLGVRWEKATAFSLHNHEGMGGKLGTERWISGKRDSKPKVIYG